MTDAAITLDALGALLAEAAGDRQVVAIAGAPGSGKSTVADELVERLNHAAPDSAAVLPMDGFHYDDLYLVPAGLRPRKGAPETFDVGGLRTTLERLRAREDRIAVPVFDRSIEIARAGARLIGSTTRIIVAEGNYLLLDRAPWSDLAQLFDVTVMIAVEESVLRERLIRRWEHFGLSPDQIAEKLEENDLPNGRIIRAASRAADYRLET